MTLTTGQFSHRRREDFRQPGCGSTEGWCENTMEAIEVVKKMEIKRTIIYKIRMKQLKFQA